MDWKTVDYQLSEFRERSAPEKSRRVARRSPPSLQDAQHLVPADGSSD